MSEWRPEGWKNPYLNDVVLLYHVFEEGADAMLRTLKAQGTHTYPKSYYHSIGEIGSTTPGTIVFIGDETEKKTQTDCNIPH